MKILKKQKVMKKRKVIEHTLTERSVLEAIRDFPFLVTLHYAFQTEAKLHLIMGGCVLEWALSAAVMLFLHTDYICGGELFSHLHERGPFSEPDARVYAAEITLALERLHSV